MRWHDWETHGGGGGIAWRGGIGVTGGKRSRSRKNMRFLLLFVFVIGLAVPVFNRVGPVLFGFPFFYWYQIAAIPVSSVLIYLVFRAEDRG